MCCALSALLKDCGLNVDLQQCLEGRSKAQRICTILQRHYLFWWWSPFFWYAEIRNQLVEQFRYLEQQSESRLQLLQDLQDFFRRKAELQLEYSRGLDKLAERYSAKIRTSREHQHLKWVSPLPVCSALERRIWLINQMFHSDHCHITERWKKRERERKRTGEWSNKNERRDKSRRNDLKWSQGQGSLWPQAAVFLPTRSDSLSPPPPTTTAPAFLCGCHFISILKQLHARLLPKYSQEYRSVKKEIIRAILLRLKSILNVCVREICGHETNKPCSMLRNSYLDALTTAYSLLRLLDHFLTGAHAHDLNQWS